MIALNKGDKNVERDEKIGGKTGAILKSIKDSSMQNSMRDDSLGIQSSDLNSSLAICFYNFLVGKAAKLPIHEFIDKITDIELRKNQPDTLKPRSILISMACRMNVSYVDSDERYLIVEEETPLSPSKSRFDQITHKGYKAYTIRTISYIRSDYEDISPEEQPIFSPRRVELFQNYLKEYSLRLNAIDEMFSESDSNQKSREK